jgi:hypothetical protein
MKPKTCDGHNRIPVRKLYEVNDILITLNIFFKKKYEQKVIQVLKIIDQLQNSVAHQKT